MKSVLDLLSELSAEGVAVWLEDSNLRFAAPAPGLPARRLAELTSRRDEIREFLEKAKRTPHSAALQSTAVAQPRKQPLSFEQERLWFLHLLDPQSTAYLVTGAFRLSGRICTLALEQALDTMVQRHEALRTIISGPDEEPFAAVSSPSRVLLRRVDLRDVAGVEDLIQTLIRQETGMPMNLRDAPLRACLVHMGDDQNVLLISVHHLVFDEWSLAIVTEDMRTLYEAFVRGLPHNLPQAEAQAGELATTQRARHLEGAHQGGLRYWTGKLGGVPASVYLPLDNSRRSIHRGPAQVEELQLNASLMGSVRGLSRQQSTTWPVVVMAAWFAVIARYSGEEDICIGMPISLRDLPGSENTVGMLVNTVALRCDLSGDPSFRSLVEKMTSTIGEAREHQHVPFQIVVQNVGSVPRFGNTALFQLAVAFTETLRAGSMGEAWLQPERVPPGQAKFDLLVFCGEDGKICLEYDADLFEAVTIRQLVQRFATFLQSAVAEPHQRLSDFPLQLVDPAHKAINNKDTICVPFSFGTFLERFGLQVQRTSDATAVLWLEKDGALTHLSYRELDEQSNRIARRLMRLGLGSECRVAVCLDATPSRPTALLAILKSGAAYVPLDLRWTMERWKAIVRDSAARFSITHHAYASLAGLKGTRTLIWEELVQAAATDAESSCILPAPASLSHILYTSGSTGKPKGIAIEHRNLDGFLCWAVQFFSRAELSFVLAATPLCFDISTFELFAPLCAGGTVVMADSVIAATPVMHAVPLSLLNTVPSVVDEMVRCHVLPGEIMTANLAGEPLSRETVENVFVHSSANRALNLYGPSETTTYSTAAEMRKGFSGKPPLGDAVDGTAIYLLDRHLRPIAQGLAGEIAIGGAGVSRGYLGVPERTAERYLPDPYALLPGSRMFRTGDMARRRVDGSLEFLGRRDHQIKLRGQRIELGEIESNARQHPLVQSAAATVVQDASGPRLALYVVSEPGATLSKRDLRLFLSDHLPEFMMPGDIVFLEKMPVTSSGKVDRLSLPPAEQEREDARTEIVSFEQGIVSEIWSEVLGRGVPDIDQPFFAVGGNSLLLLRVAQKLGQRLERPIAVLDLFRWPTIRSLGEYLSGAGHKPPSAQDTSRVIRSQTALRGSMREAYRGSRPRF